MILKIDNKNINEFIKESIRKSIEKSKNAHFTNIQFRINGEEELEEADWIKYIKVQPENGHE